MVNLQGNAKKVQGNAKKLVKVTDPSSNSQYVVHFSSPLGDGAFGKVYDAYSEKDKKMCAVKILNKKRLRKIDRDVLYKEVKFLQRCSHTNIVKFIALCDDKSKFYMFMERCQVDMLDQILTSKEKCLDERTTRFLTMQIVVAVKYLHDKDIAHCDLKPENILFDKRLSENPLPLIKLCDFGYARIMSKLSIRRSMKGTQPYAAPELLLNKNHNRSLDIWSLGVVVYVSLSGFFPFIGNSMHKLVQDQERKLSLPKKLYKDLYFSSNSADAKDFMKQLLTKGKSRISIDDVLALPWLQNNKQLHKDVKTLEQRIGHSYITNDPKIKWSQKTK